MALIVADSDVLIDALRGRDDARARIAVALREEVLATTAVNLFELESGARTDDQRDKVARLLAPTLILPLDQEAADHAAAVRRRLEAEGRGIGMADYLIAGICLARGAALYTRNRTHFERVEGLRLVD